MPTVLIVAPSHDTATSYTSLGAKAVEEYFDRKGWRIMTLYGARAVRERLERVASKADMIVYIGHGKKDRWYGQLPQGFGTPLLDRSNIDVLRGKVVLTIACFAGQMGEVAIRRDAKVYIGWRDVVYVGGLEQGYNYVKDFMHTFLELALDIADGKPVRVAVEDYRLLCQHYESYYEREKPMFWDVYRNYMRHNRINIVVFRS